MNIECLGIACFNHAKLRGMLDKSDHIWCVVEAKIELNVGKYLPGMFEYIHLFREANARVF